MRINADTCSVYLLCGHVSQLATDTFTNISEKLLMQAYVLSQIAHS